MTTLQYKDVLCAKAGERFNGQYRKIPNLNTGISKVTKTHTPFRTKLLRRFVKFPEIYHVEPTKLFKNSQNVSQ